MCSILRTIMAAFSLRFMNLMNLYDVEKLLPDSERIEMYVQIYEELNDNNGTDLIFHDILCDIMNSLKNYYYELRKKKKKITPVFKQKLKKVINIDILEKNILEINQNHIYNDSQNVHDFVSGAIKVAKKIIHEFPAQYQRLFDHVFFDTIENITVENCGLSGTDLFASIHFYIINHKHKDEMLKRLLEEMNESVGTCSSGHIIRMINSVKGFENDFVDVFLDEYEAEKAKLFNEINKRLDASDLFSIDDFEILINGGTVELPFNSQITVRILKDYSKIEWFSKIINGKTMFFYK